MLGQLGHLVLRQLLLKDDRRGLFAWRRVVTVVREAYHAVVCIAQQHWEIDVQASGLAKHKEGVRAFSKGVGRVLLARLSSSAGTRTSCATGAKVIASALLFRRRTRRSSTADSGPATSTANRRPAGGPTSALSKFAIG